MRRLNTLAALLVLLHLLLALVFSVWNPLGEAPDEVDHWSYVLYLAREQRLPSGPRVTQSKHPPFYHAGAAAVASLAEASFDFLRANPDVAIAPSPTQSPNFFVHTTLEAWPWQDGALAFHLARLWSVALSTLAVAAVYGLARAALPERPGIALAATGLAAALPEFAFVGSAVNNDGAAALWATLGLWGGFAIYQGYGRLRPGWWTPLALGFGLLAKVSTITLWPVVGLLIILGAARRGHLLGPGSPQPLRVWLRRALAAWPRWVGTGLAVFLPAIVLAAPWLLRNWRLYGDPLGMALVRETVDVRMTPWSWGDTVWLLRGWFLSFWGKFGGAGHIPYPDWVYWLLAVLSLAGVVGLAVQVRRERALRLPAALLALAVLAVALGIWRYSLLALGTDQGRLLFPALGPLVLLLALGLAAPGSRRTPSHVGSFRRVGYWLGAALVVGLAALAFYGLAGVIRPAFAPPPSPSAAELAVLPNMQEAVRFGELTLAGWSLAETPVLYWRAETAPTQDWRTNLRVVAEDGSLVWEWRRSPGYGRWSTDHWPAGAVLRDAYAVNWPDWAGPGRYRIEVGLMPYGGELVLPTDPPDAASAGHPYIFLGWLERQ
jgi:hypothetical protein